MFKLIGWCLKACFFAAIVLVASHYVTWGGRTVSDQVRSSLSSAERSQPLKAAKKKSRALLEDAKEAASNVGIRGDQSGAKGTRKIPQADRERLQAVIGGADGEG